MGNLFRGPQVTSEAKSTRRLSTMRWQDIFEKNTIPHWCLMSEIRSLVIGKKGRIKIIWMRRWQPWDCNFPTEIGSILISVKKFWSVAIFSRGSQPNVTFYFAWLGLIVSWEMTSSWWPNWTSWWFCWRWLHCARWSRCKGWDWPTGTPLFSSGNFSAFIRRFQTRSVIFTLIKHFHKKKNNLKKNHSGCWDPGTSTKK